MSDKLTQRKIEEMVEKILKENFNPSSLGSLDFQIDDTNNTNKEFVHDKKKYSYNKFNPSSYKDLKDLDNTGASANIFDENDLIKALEFKNGLLVNDKTIVEPALKMLADYYTQSPDKTIAKKIISSLYYNLDPKSQLNSISDVVADSIATDLSSGAATADKSTKDIIKQEIGTTSLGSQVKVYIPPSFNASALNSAQIQDIYDKQTQLDVSSKLPDVKITENWAVNSKDAVPHLFATARDSVFSSAGTDLESRLKSLESFFNSLQSGTIPTTASTLQQKKDAVSENFNKILMLQGLINLARGTTGDTGGWIFEAFVASLLHGKKEGGNYQIEDVVWNNDKNKLIGYSLKFKSSDEAGSAVSNFVRFFFDRKKKGKYTKIKGTDLASQKITDPVTRQKVEIGGNLKLTSQSMATKALKKEKAFEQTGKMFFNELQGKMPEKLSIVYGKRSSDYKKVDFLQMDITLKEGQILFAAAQTPTGRKQIATLLKRNEAKDAAAAIKQILNHILTSSTTTKIASFDFSDANIQAYETNAASTLQTLKVDIDDITESFNRMKTFCYSYFQNFKPEVAAQTKVEFTNLKTKLNETYEEYGSGVVLESKLKTIDDLIAETMRDIKRKRKK